MAGPLEGIKVIECNRVAPGSLATVLLADMGADVIRVVEPSPSLSLIHISEPTRPY